MDKIAIMVAAHKPYWMPEDQSMYLPLQVGAAGQGSIGCQRDDQGENISDKNQTFCELTGQYWAWKNIDADFYGLCHYRRYFGTRDFWKTKKARILMRPKVLKLLEKSDLILPKKRHYWIETNQSQYEHAHHATDLTTTKQIIQECFPEYLPSWEKVMSSRSGHRFNMYVMRRDLFFAYSQWLFSILFILERRLDISKYKLNDKRVFGFVAERLLDVWVVHHQIRYVECSVINLESQKWGKKIVSFIRRKFTKRFEV